MEVYSGVYNKGASGTRVAMSAGPPAMGADVVAAEVATEQSSDTRHWM